MNIRRLNVFWIITILWAIYTMQREEMPGYTSLVLILIVLSKIVVRLEDLMDFDGPTLAMKATPEL